MAKRKKTRDSSNALIDNMDRKQTGASLKALPVAVIGVGALFPGSADPGGFWRDILDGKDHIVDVPESHWIIDDYYDADPRAKDKCYAKTGAFLSPLTFNPMEYSIPPANLSATDTAQLLGLIVAKQVLNDASNGQFKRMDRDRISVVLGVAAGLELLGEVAGRLQRPVWVRALREEGLPESRVNEICDRILSNYVEWKESTFPGLLGNVVAGRIANHFDLGGMNCTSDAACASSFSAMKMALDELYLGESDVVITGGVDTANGPFLYTCFSKTPALSMTGDSRPFSAEADGMILGEGIGMVALKRLEDAERDGDRIYAVIRGIGASSDGGGTSVYAPAVSGQAKCLERAYHSAGYGPETVEMMEAHGTATIVGDKVEVDALNQVFDKAGRKDRQWCALGSVKSQIGHTKSAAAVAGLIKAVMAVHHKVLPPTIKVDKPHPAFEIEKTPFYINTKTRPWITHGDYPRRASVSSFGFGGTNFHVTLEEYLGTGKQAFRMRVNPAELVFFTANDAKGMVQTCETALQDHIETEGLLYYLARTSQETFDKAHPCRLAVIADSEKDLAEKLRQAQEKIAENPDAAFSFPHGIYYNPKAEETGKTAFVFSGQGSQYPDMGRDIALFDPAAQDVWDMSASIVMEGEKRLSDVVFPKPVFSDEEKQAITRELTQTQWAQPAICTISLSMLEILSRVGLSPDCVAGHSLGEVTALYAAGVIDKEGLIKIARKRGELMARASSQKGAMTAVSEPSEKIKTLLEKWDTGVIIANHNSPKQVVLSGALTEIEDVEKKLKDQGMKPHRLPVSTAFHSSLMTDSCDPFKAFIDGIDFKTQSLPVYSNADAKPYSKKNIRKTLTRQINHPVRFVEQIEAMYESGVRTFIEVGPGGILSKLIGQCLDGRPHTVVSLDKKGAHGVTSLFRALGQLAVNGLPIDFSALWESYAPADEDPRKKEKPLMTVTLSGANYGKIYPPPEGAKSLPRPNPEEPKKDIAAAAISHLQKPKESSPMHARQSSSQTQRFAQEDVLMAKKSSEEELFRNFPPADETYDNAGKPGSKYYNIHKPDTASMRSRAGKTTPDIRKASLGSSPQGGQSWLNAFQEIQRQTAETHSTFQKNLAETYVAFLENSEETNRMLFNLMAGRTTGHIPEARSYDSPRPGVAYTGNTGAAAEMDRQEPVAAPKEPPAVQVKAQAPFMQSGIQVRGADTQPGTKTQPQKEAAPSSSYTPASDVDFEAMLIDVVSEKTGYPKEILSLGMSLEADLGIDSIKRVEIFFSVKDDNPWMPEVDPGDMGDITTLGDVLDFIKTQARASGPAVSVNEPSPVAGAPADMDFDAMLIDVVSEKTGYPKEILSLGMSLEADLGIDSIKRVEIFSSVKDDNPWMPEVDPGDMGDITTLGDVLDFIKTQARASGPAVSTSEPAPVAGAPADMDFEAMLIDVVSEKTGYPKDILSLGMSLEADLGIDSIKRVEIFSSVKDDNPWMPEVDPGDMGDIKTLGDVLDFIKTQARASGPAVSTSEPAPVAGAPADMDFEAMLIDVVSEKTGYPKDILSLEMSLEADLGIDSIKRVEIFSSVKDENPWMPEVDPGDMGDIKTLGDVLAFITSHAGVSTETAPVQSVEPSSSPLSSIPADMDFKQMLLGVVADKTGYPVDILQWEMSLEADLGIDSIKRVEIFSSVKDENPWMPEVDPGEMGHIQTLGDVLEFIENHAKGLGGSTHENPETEVDTAKKEKEAGIGRYALREVMRPHAGFQMAGLKKESAIVITPDHRGVAEALASRLKKKHLNVKVSDTISEETDGVIFLGGLRECVDEDAAIAVNKEAFRAARSIADKLTEHGGLFVTVQDTGGDFNLSGSAGHRAFLGGLPGLVKTAGLEWPKASLKAIDIDTEGKTADVIAGQITRELFTGGPEKEVGIHGDGSRYTLQSYAADPNSMETSMDSSSVIIASGGARGVTASTLIELAHRATPRIVLLGRTPLDQEPDFTRQANTDAELKSVLLEHAKQEGQAVTPAELGSRAKKILAAREINSTLDELAAAGSQATYVSCDVRDAQSINEALAPVRESWGPVTGIVHGAGVLTDKLIAEKTEDQFDLVFNTKVQGLRSLLSATKDDPVSMICLFSSIAARSGNFGQCDYAMANEILNKVANGEKARRKEACVVKSINWGPWDGGMVSPLLKDYFNKMGVPLIPLAEGARRMVEEVMEGDQGSVEIVIGPCPPASLFQTLSENHEASLHLMVNSNDYPFIDNHRIKDNPVVPMAMVLEWFSRAAQVCRPDLDVLACRDLTVLKGIQLNDFSETGSQITCTCRQITNGNGSVMEIDIPGINGSSHYRATIEMGKACPSCDKTLAVDEITSQLGTWPWDTTDIYKEKLFHGPDFQVIKKLEGVSDTAAAAVLNGVDSMNWPGALWKTDAAAIDGGLQLAILWGMTRVGKQSLPTKIGSYVNYKTTLPNGPIHCVLQGQVIDGNRTVSDISFFNENKELLAEMQGVEMHMLPN